MEDGTSGWALLARPTLTRATRSSRARFRSLFPDIDKATQPVATVADVHSAPPQSGAAGVAMHMGVGGVDMAVIAVPAQEGEGTGTTFVGPVSSHLSESWAGLLSHMLCVCDSCRCSQHIGLTLPCHLV